MCKLNARHNASFERQARICQFLTNHLIAFEVLHACKIDFQSPDLDDTLDAIMRELGMPRSLSDLNVSREKLDSLAVNSLHDPWCKTNSVPLIEKEQMLEILNMILNMIV